jgi:hypothetical protein
MSVVSAFSNTNLIDDKSRVENRSLYVYDDGIVENFDQLDMLLGEIDPCYNCTNDTNITTILDSIDDEFLTSPIPENYHHDEVSVSIGIGHCDNDTSSLSGLLDAEVEADIWNDCCNDNDYTLPTITFDLNDMEVLVRSRSTSPIINYSSCTKSCDEKLSMGQSPTSIVTDPHQRAVSPYSRSSQCNSPTFAASNLEEERYGNEPSLMSQYNQSLRKLANSMRRTDETRNFIKRQRLCLDTATTASTRVACEKQQEQQNSSKGDQSNIVFSWYQNPAVQEIRNSLLQSIQYHLNHENDLNV